MEDMNFDLDYDQSLIPMQQDYHVSYVLAMSDLAVMRMSFSAVAV
jgi:hypothetical protein